MEKSWEEKIIEAGYRRLARQNHPDRGGSEENMAAINAAVQRLRGFVDTPTLDSRLPIPDSQAMGRDCPACGVHDGITLKARPFKQMSCPACGFSGISSSARDVPLDFLWNVLCGPYVIPRRNETKRWRALAQIISELVHRTS